MKKAEIRLTLGMKPRARPDPRNISNYRVFHKNKNYKYSASFLSLYINKYVVDRPAN